MNELLQLFGEIIAVYSENRTKHKHTYIIYIYIYMTFEDLTEVNMKIIIIRDVTPYSMVDVFQRVAGTSYAHPLPRKLRRPVLSER
jgi:hypothetical protein